MDPPRARRAASPVALLLLMAAGMSLSFSTWQALLNNFAVERAAFDGADIGLLQSVREIPGFLSFAVVFLLLVIREQALALVALLLLGVGTAVTGLFPSLTGLLVTTFVMSVGFHYYEAVQQSLAMQWVSIEKLPEVLGRVLAVLGMISIFVYGALWLAFDRLGLAFEWIYLAAGGATVLLALVGWLGFPRFQTQVEQHKHLVLRRRYWLYYALTFMGGARRQIFIVFAGFLMIEKFGYTVAQISFLFLVNAALNMLFARRIGRLIGRIGERRALLAEYLGLIVIFVSYAFVSVGWLAAMLYVFDHFFFALSIAIKSYFQKIADPRDLASSAGVAFTINHIAAVLIPVSFGLLWLVSPAAVFLSGAAMAGISLVLAALVPRQPGPRHETVLMPRPTMEVGVD